VAKAAEARSQDFNARLTKAALAYVGFALKRPALFALMFEAKRRPFAILFRELSAEQKGKLHKRAQHWPEPLGKQVARAAGAAERFRGRSNGFFGKMDRKCLRFNCSRQSRVQIPLIKGIATLRLHLSWNKSPPIIWKVTNT
jgi:hypothetical protein